MRPSATRLRIRAVGDLMTGDSPVRFGFGAGSALERRGPAEMGGRLKRLLGGADLVIGNLESPISPAGWRTTSYVSEQLLGHPATARVLAEGGFTCVNVANNHIMQHGEAAFRHTVRELEQRGISVVGLGGRGRVAPVVDAIGGVRIGLLGASLRPETHAGEDVPYALAEPDGEALVAAIRELRGRSDLCIVSLHWGAEYMPAPSPGQRTLARRLRAAGADIVLGHHPHVLQPLELEQGGLVAYSLGNFVFDMFRSWPRRSAVLDLEWEPGQGCSRVSLHPVRLDRDGWPAPAPAPDGEAPIVAGAPGPGPPGSTVDEARYWSRAGRAEVLNAWLNRAYFLRHILRYPRGVRRQAIGYFFARRAPSR